MDARKILKIAALPIGIIVAMYLIQTIAHVLLFPTIQNEVLLAISNLLSLLEILVLVWGGYRASKTFGADLKTGAMVGAISAIVSLLIYGSINFAIAYMLNGVSIRSGYTANNMMNQPILFLLALFVLFAITLAFGALCGAIGVFIENRTGKGKKTNKI
jgi:hypothetical protein